MEYDIKGKADNNIETTEKTYLTGEVAKMIGIAPTTIRKYSQSLQEQGYTFLKGKGTGHRQARLFTEKDVTVLSYLKEVRKETNITVDRATGVVIERFGKGTTQDTLPISEPLIEDIRQHDKQHDELKEMINKLRDEVHNQSEYMIKQNELIGNLINRIDQQDEYIIDKLDAPTEQKEIETPKEIKEESPKIEEAPKKSFFSKILDKLIIDTSDNK